MEAANSSETTANVYWTTRRNNREDSHVQISGGENLNSHYFHHSFLQKFARQRSDKSLLVFFFNKILRIPLVTY
jgi:hypothetical protein